MSTTLRNGVEAAVVNLILRLVPLVTDTVRARLVDPTNTLPNATLVGESVSPAALAGAALAAIATISARDKPNMIGLDRSVQP